MFNSEISSINYVLEKIRSQNDSSFVNEIVRELRRNGYFVDRLLNGDEFKEVARELRRNGYFVDKLKEGNRYLDPVQITLNRSAWGKYNDTLFHEIASDSRIRNNTLMGFDRMYIIWQALLNTRFLNAPTMEAGVYRGGTSAFIVLATEKLESAAKKHYAIDTFSGHAHQDLSSIDVHTAGLFSDNSIADVELFFCGISDRVEIIAGRLDAIENKILKEEFSFVHLDMDIFEPTCEYLRFIDDRLLRGGVIIVDDYMAPKCPGIKKSVDEFLAIKSKKYQVWYPPTEQVILNKIG
jgi:O-methyltransferase